MARGMDSRVRGHDDIGTLASRSYDSTATVLASIALVGEAQTVDMLRSGYPSLFREARWKGRCKLRCCPERTRRSLFAVVHHFIVTCLGPAVPRSCWMLSMYIAVRVRPLPRLPPPEQNGCGPSTLRSPLKKSAASPFLTSCH